MFAKEFLFNVYLMDDALQWGMEVEDMDMDLDGVAGAEMKDDSAARGEGEETKQGLCIAAGPHIYLKNCLNSDR